MTASHSKLAGTDLDYYPLAAYPSSLPMTVKVLLEGLLRMSESGTADEASVHALASWPSLPPKEAELPFLPARVLMQDFTGVPAGVDLAAVRAAMQRAGKGARDDGPLEPGDLVIDHAVHVDPFGVLA